MRSNSIACVGLALVTVTRLLCPAGSAAWANADSAAHSPLMLPGVLTAQAVWPNGGATILLSEVTLLVVCALVSGLLVIGIELLDAWRDRREGEAARLASRIATALRRDRFVGGWPVTPIVRLPAWGRSRGVRVEMRGRLPNHWLRRAALRAAEREIAVCAIPCRIVDQIEIVPSTGAVAA